MQNKIIINADDFGWSESCSKAIIKAFESGYISTTTACANGDYFDDAVKMIKGTPFEKLVGIHINLTEGRPLSDGIKNNPLFCNENGEYIYFPHRFKLLSKKDKKDVYYEITAQVERFKSSGLEIHHADSHHHVHNAMNIFPIYLRVMKEQGVTKIRRFRNLGQILFIKKIMKNLYNRKLTKSDLAYSDYFCEIGDYRKEYFKQITDKTIELMSHPDFDKNGKLVDRDGTAQYADPFGEELSLFIESINNNGDVLTKNY